MTPQYSVDSDSSCTGTLTVSHNMKFLYCLQSDMLKRNKVQCIFVKTTKLNRL